MAADDDPAARRRTLSRLVHAERMRVAAAAVTVDFAADSRPAPGRVANEDQHLVVRLSRQQQTLATSLSAADVPPTYDEYGYAMLVADGMGRDGAGGLASRIALATVARLSIAFGRWNLRIDERTAMLVSEQLEWLYQQVEDTLNYYARSSLALAEMGTTMTATFSAGADLFLAHVGHSRAYLYRGGELTQLTRDQTLDQHRSERRGPARIDLVVQDLSHLLTDVLGGAGRERRAIGVERIRLRDDDHIILATDGLTAVVDEDDISDVLAHRRALDEHACLLLDLARHRGSADDATVIVARYGIPQDVASA